MKLLSSLVIIILIGFGWWFIQGRQEVVEEVVSQVATSTQTYTWKFIESEADATGVPHTSVSLSVNDKTYVLGEYEGSCREVKTGESGVVGEKNDPTEISRIQCWFAGGGNELGVFQEEGKLVVRAGELGEGEEGGKPFRGNFKTILEL